jgi:hypothetical protein
MEYGMEVLAPAPGDLGALMMRVDKIIARIITINRMKSLGLINDFRCVFMAKPSTLQTLQQGF